MQISVLNRLCGSFWQGRHAICTATWGLEAYLLYEVWYELVLPTNRPPHTHCSWSLNLGWGREYTALACSRLTLECGTTSLKVSYFFSSVVWVSRVVEPRDCVRRQVSQATSDGTQAGPFCFLEPLAFRECVK